MGTEIGVFILTFLVIFLIYEIFLVRKCKKDIGRKQPIEVHYLVNCYKLDLLKLNYKRLLNIISVVSAFDIALVVTLMSLAEGFLLELAIGFIATIIVILISYTIIGKVYQKKGCTKTK